MLLRQKCLESLRRSPRQLIAQLYALRKARTPTHDMIATLLALAVDFQRGEKPQVKNPEVIRFLFHWLPDIESVPIRIAIVRRVVELARNGLHSLMRLAASGLIMDLIALLSQPERIYDPSKSEGEVHHLQLGLGSKESAASGSNAEVLGGIFTLLKILGSHSITEAELRAVFLRLLRGKRDGKPYPYTSQVLFALIEMAKREGFRDSQYFFDIQHSRDAMTVGGMKKWPGSGNSYTFHCWVRLVAENGSSTSEDRLRRRYLYSFQIGSGPSAAGFEAFFGPKGVLTISVWNSKDTHAASLFDFPLGDGRWHCVTISHSANWRSIRPFTQSQLNVYLDGTQRLTCNLRSPVLSQPLSEIVIGGVGSRHRMGLLGISGGADGSPSHHPSSSPGGSPSHFAEQPKPKLEEKKSFFGNLVSAVPNILPQLSQFPGSSRGKSGGDSNVRVIPFGAEEAAFGEACPLKGQIGPVMVFHDAVSAQQAKDLYTVGPNCPHVFSGRYLAFLAAMQSDGNGDSSSQGGGSGSDMSLLSSSTSSLSISPEGELELKLAFWYDARVTSSGEKLCVDLSPNRSSSAHCSAPVWILTNIRDALNKIGGIHVLFPLLEKLPSDLDVDLSLVSPTSGSALPPVVMTTYTGQGEEAAGTSLGEWEVISTKDEEGDLGREGSNRGLVRNQVAGFFSLVRILSAESLVCLDQLMRYRAIPVMGYLLQKLPPALVDVNLLISLELLCEQLRDQRRETLLDQMYLYVLFDFRIWTNCSFPVRIGHFQALCRIIHEDKHYFRKNFGVQFLLDVIHQHYKHLDRLSAEDNHAMRTMLMSLIKYFISREPTAAEISAILRFVFSVHEEEVVLDILEMLNAYLESKSAKDQLFLLMYENGNAELLYGLLIQKHFSAAFKELVCKIMTTLMRTEKVPDKYKTRLRLADIGHGGFFAFLKGQVLSEGVAAQLACQLLMTDAPSAYNGILLLVNQLQYADRIETKLTVGRIIQAALHNRQSAAVRSFARQLGWQCSLCWFFAKDDRKDMVGSSSRVSVEEGSALSPSTFVNSLSLDVENDPDLMTFELIDSSSGRGVKADMAAAWQMLPQQFTEIRDMAETVGSVVSENIHAVTSVISDNLETVTSAVVPDKIQSAASTVSKSVASKFSSIKRRTMQAQESVEEIGESIVAIGEAAVSSLRKSRESPMSSGPNSPFLNPKMLLGRTKEAGAPHGSMGSFEELSSNLQSDYKKSHLRRGRSPLRRSRFYSDSTVLSKDDGSILSLQQEVDTFVDFAVHLITSVMWEGVEAAGVEDVWKERAVVFCCLKELSITNHLFAPLLDIQRRILEKLIDHCMELPRDEPQITPAARENRCMVLKWAYHLIVHEDQSVAFPRSGKCILTSFLHGTALSERLLDKIISLLDVLGVFGDSPEEEWRDLTAMSLAILVKCAASENLDLCAMATARLHFLVQSRPFAYLEETAYLLACLCEPVYRAIEMQNTEHYSFLIPVIKALLDKVGSLGALHLPAWLPSLPLGTTAPSFDEEFQHYCQTPEWRDFVETKILPLRESHHLAWLKEVDEKSEAFWKEAQEALVMSIHKRNRECGESKLKFQANIVCAYKGRVSEERNRLARVILSQKVQAALCKKSWRATKQFLEGPKGPWRAWNIPEQRWRLSSFENQMRMRLKMTLNATFDNHLHASKLRDNQGDFNRCPSEGLLPWGIAQKAVRRKNESTEAEDEDEITEDDDPSGGGTPSAPSMSLMGTHDSPARRAGAPGSPLKVLLSEDCVLVELMSTVRGKLDVNSSYMHFCDLSAFAEDVPRKDFWIPMNRLREIHLRRYNLRRSAVEFFLTDHSSYLINFPSTKSRNRVFRTLLSVRPPNLLSRSGRPPAHILRTSGLTQKWANRQISNFEYLMHLNTIAGRTYNDLSQYPVFPWILSDYESGYLDLNDPACFRDLRKPMGVVNSKNEAEVRQKYETFEDMSGTVPKFHYGTHYSNSAGVLHYLVRVEPFTSLHIELQSGRFDVADRQFHSLKGTWQLLMEGGSDVKELIPEFFYLPEFFLNSNKFDLGRLQSGEKVDDVILPSWASNPVDFVHKHRKALESEFVSHNLHHWIDLIFGFKQKGAAAIEALNVFYYCSYEGAVDLDAIADAAERAAIEGMINNFGQTPCQLLKDPHPRRISHEEYIQKAAKDFKPSNLLSFTQYLTKTTLQISSRNDPVILCFIPPHQHSPARASFIQHSGMDTLLTLTASGILGNHSWLPFDKANPHAFSFFKDNSTHNARSMKKIGGACFDPSLLLSQAVFAPSNDGKTVFCGGYWDGSIGVYFIPRAKIIQSLHRHTGVVTCLAVDTTDSLLLSGSKDTTCVLWSVGPPNSSSSLTGGAGVGSVVGVGVGGPYPPAGCLEVDPRPLFTFYGHDAPVTCVSLCAELDMAISGSEDGTVNIHSIQEGCFMFSLLPPPYANLTNPEVTLLTVSYMGYIAVYFEEKESSGCHLDIYSVNGKHLFAHRPSHPILSMIAKGDHILTGDIAGMLCIREIHGLAPVSALGLDAPPTSMSFAPGGTHLLASLTNGTVAVVNAKLASS